MEFRLLLLVFGACYAAAQSPAVDFRHALDDLKKLLEPMNAPVQLQQVDEMAMCPELVAIVVELHGCVNFDDDGSLFNQSLTPEEFCGACNLQSTYDAAAALPYECHHPSEYIESIRLILPIIGGICATDTNGDLCAAEPMLSLFGGVDGLNLIDDICQDEDCPVFESMTARMFDCSPQILLYLSLCVKVHPYNYCVGPLSEVMDDGFTQDSVGDFCRNECSGELYEFWETRFPLLPECSFGLDSSQSRPVDPQLFCSAKLDASTGGVEYCIPQYESPPTISVACNFSGDPAEWPCEPDCATELTAMADQLGCCADTAWGYLMGIDMIPDMQSWLGTCAMVEYPEECQNIPTPVASEECLELRDQHFGISETIRCLVEFHEER